MRARHADLAKLLGSGILAAVVLLFSGGCEMRRAGRGWGLVKEEADPAIRDLVEVLRASQPAPYRLPDNDSTFNYGWAQFMMALVAAERCGYMDREEVIARVSGMLDLIEPLERYYGFSYDSYDLETNKKATDKIYFQGWWLFALCVLKNAYPELAPRCEKLLGELDYENSGLFNPETRQLAADFYPEKEENSFWIDLYWQPTGEFRTPYVVYTYLTGDISPWTRWTTPRLIDLEGHPTLGVWHNFFFCTMFVHAEFPDLGYLERSWDELIQGLNTYRERNGMLFYPTRAEPLEAWLDVEQGKWPNTEHRVAKPWLAWFGGADAPVMEKAWSPGYGITLYYDSMNMYWSFGDRTVPCDGFVGTDADGRTGWYDLPFFVMMLPGDVEVPNPPRLKSVSLLASRTEEAPAAPLELRLNGKVLATAPASDIGTEPTEVRVTLPDHILTQHSNHLVIACADATPGRGYRVYRHDKSTWTAWYEQEGPAGQIATNQVEPPAVEIVIDGQHDGRENSYALLVRCAVVHGYHVWHEMLNDPSFLETTVVWVGEYYDRARLGRVVHNVSDTPVTVHYERPGDWTMEERVRVYDITDGGERPVAITVSEDEVNWRAEARRTYRIRYEGDDFGPRNTQNHTEESA